MLRDENRKSENYTARKAALRANLLLALRRRKLPEEEEVD
jgi:hypothetical protein